jgi:hypothetical protein
MRPRAPVLVLAAAVALLVGCLIPLRAHASVSSGVPPVAERVPSSERSGTSLEAAAKRAGTTGRTVAMSLIGLAFAIAATVLAFRRDFKEAAGVFAVGIVSILLATPAGLNVLRDTVSSLFGS